MHVRFFQFTPPFTMVATRAGCDHIGPNVLTTQMTWNYVVNG